MISQRNCGKLPSSRKRTKVCVHFDTGGTVRTVCRTAPLLCFYVWDLIVVCRTSFQDDFFYLLLQGRDSPRTIGTMHNVRLYQMMSVGVSLKDLALKI